MGVINTTLKLAKGLQEGNETCIKRLVRVVAQGTRQKGENTSINDELSINMC